MKLEAARQMATIDDEYGSGHVAGRRGGKQEHGTVEIFKFPEASLWNAFNKRLTGAGTP
ncbi:hypothetical protein NK8_83990 (plasmid) [Caballeronia sp. NK8]|nr:hypothetical protein NK8_83990 [Caballeronia sp. NK8]